MSEEAVQKLEEASIYIDKRELARRISKTVRTVDTWMEKGWIPFYRVGRTVCFKWEEVDAHIQANFRVNSGRR